MKFAKPALSFSDQADMLLRRGLVADRDELIRRLEQVNYYRLSAYWYPFRQPGSDDLQPGTTLATIWDRYVFDRQLRVLVMDAIERVEVVKTRLANTLALQHGPFAHVDRRNLPNLEVHRHRELLDKIRKGGDRSHEPFVTHFQSKYTSETDLPLWMAIEVMNYGCMLTLFRGCAATIKQQIAANLGIADRVLESWLVALNTIRNICAHHARLWDRNHGTAVMIPRDRRHPQWHHPVDTARNPRSTFAMLIVLRYLLRFIAPQSGWPQRLDRLWAEKHPNIPIDQMGFPTNWKECPIWSQP